MASTTSLGPARTLHRMSSAAACTAPMVRPGMAVTSWMVAATANSTFATASSETVDASVVAELIIVGELGGLGGDGTDRGGLGAEAASGTDDCKRESTAVRRAARSRANFAPSFNKSSPALRRLTCSSQASSLVAGRTDLAFCCFPNGANREAFFCSLVAGAAEDFDCAFFLASAPRGAWNATLVLRRLWMAAGAATTQVTTNATIKNTRMCVCVKRSQSRDQPKL